MRKRQQRSRRRLRFPNSAHNPSDAGEMAKVVIATFLWMLVATTLAFAEDVDWKMYGSVKLSGEKAVCFFDAKSVNHRANGYIRVWTKWLPTQDLKHVDPELAEKIADKANKKLHEGYLPP